MTYTLENSFLSLTVESKGAEIVSLKNQEGTERIWTAQPEYWDRHAPLLFPCVGGNWEGLIRVNGTPYALPKHGFVQDMEFEVTEQSKDHLTLTVCDTEETRKCYPFPFRLSVSYTIYEQEVRVGWKVESPSSTDLPFMIGAHPAFLIPDFQTTDTLHGYLFFPQVEELISTPTLPKGFTHPDQKECFALEDHLLPLTNEAFLCDTILDLRGQVSFVRLLDTQRNPVAEMQFDMPVLALWSPAGGCAPFVCIEPWCGLCDTEGYRGEWSERPFMNHAEGLAAWEKIYTIRIY